MPTHPTRLRQLALVTPTSLLPRTKHLLTSIFSSPVIFTDPAVAQWGLSNFLIPLGGDIIEVVAPLPSHPGKSTTAGRLLARRGEGGYMVIMQTGDAEGRRREIESSSSGAERTVIFSHPFSYTYQALEMGWDGMVKDEGFCIQYHPKGVKGGMMPELDSHTSCKANEDPVGTRFSPWHACGKDYAGYVQGMRKTKHLHLLDVKLRLETGDGDVAAAAEQWSGTFSVPRTGDELAFSNCRMRFVKGEDGKREGLVSVTVGIEGTDQLKEVIEKAKREGVWKEDRAGKDRDDGWIEMVGVRWYVVPMEKGQETPKPRL